MLSCVVDYAAGWSPGLFSGIYRQLHLTMSRKPDEWRAAFERYVALGLPLNEGVTHFAQTVAANGVAAVRAGQKHLSICTWNLHGCMSSGEGSQPDDRLHEQVEILRTGLVRPAVLCLQEVSAGMLQQLEEQLHYTVLVRELVYAEVEQRQQQRMEDEQQQQQKFSNNSHRAASTTSAAAPPVRKHAKTDHTPPPLSCSSVAALMNCHGVQPAFCSFNVIAMRRELLDQTSAGQQFIAHVEQSRDLHVYPTRLQDGASIVERRVLSSVTLTPIDASPNTPSLRIYCTHLDSKHGAQGMTERYREAEAICQAFDQADAQEAFVLCGDLNACSEFDYTPGEQHMLTAFSGAVKEEALNFWAVLELFETRSTDCFALAQQPRPKISCWACSRVDHVLLSTRAALAWNVQRAAVYYTMASDHLPVVCWM